jgi:hypothetical protein
MRSTSLAVVFLVAVLVGGCDSTDPLRVEVETYDVAITSSGAAVETFHVYDMVEDGVAGQYMWCERIGPNDRALAPSSVPWYFTVRIQVLRAGTPDWEDLTGEEAFDPENNIASYDTTAAVVGESPIKQPITIDDNGVLRTFTFSNPRKMTAVNEAVVVQDSNPLSEFDPATYGYGDGLCSQGYPGPASIVEVELPYSVDLYKGDSIRVEARVDSSGPDGFGLDGQQVSLRGALFRDGVQISEVRGTSNTQAVYGDGFSFSFTTL